MAESFKELASAVKRRITLPPYKNVRGKSAGSIRWERLPLATTLALDGIDLDQFLTIDADITADESQAVYEEFIHGYLIDRVLVDVAPAAWVQRRLNLRERDSTWLFPNPSAMANTVPILRAMAVLLWVSHRSIEGSSFAATEDSISLTLPGGVVLGCQSGILLSRFTKGFRVPILDYSEILFPEHSENPRWSKNTAMNAALRLASREGAAVSLAVRILFWRACRLSYAESLLYNTAAAVKEQTQHLSEVIADIRENIHTQDDPRAFIRGALVPDYINSRTFMHLFGNSYRKGRPKEETLSSWLETLNQLPEFI